MLVEKRHCLQINYGGSCGAKNNAGGKWNAEASRQEYGDAHAYKFTLYT